MEFVSRKENRILYLVMVILLILSQVFMAEPVLADESSAKTGSAGLSSDSTDDNISVKTGSASLSSDSADDSISSKTGSAGLSSDSEYSEYPVELLGWISKKAELLSARYQDSIEEADRAREEKKAQERVRKALIRELLASYDLVCSITEETPWLIRVNQGTCTVTIYRVLQVQKEDIPFGRGLDTIVQEALGSENEPEEEAGKSGDSSQGKDGKGDDGMPNLQDFNPQQRQQRQDILRQFRKIGDQADPNQGQGISLMLPVYACPCSIGLDGRTPNGTFTVTDHLRWHELVGPTWGQWCSHFAPSYLFHSIPYDRSCDPNSMDQYAYNMLGKPASHGCVRLAAVDAKYIYDNIPTGTKVEIFTGQASDDPLGKPERAFVGTWDKYYDPTDPEYKP